MRGSACVWQCMCLAVGRGRLSLKALSDKLTLEAPVAGVPFADSCGTVSKRNAPATYSAREWQQLACIFGARPP